VDNKGHIHKQRYNMDPMSPRLTKGWMKLRSAFNIEGDVHVQFRYLGSNRFKIMVFAANCSGRSMQKVSAYCHNKVTNPYSLCEVDKVPGQRKSSGIIHIMSTIFIVTLGFNNLLSFLVI